MNEQKEQADSHPVRLATEPPEEIAKYLGLYLFDDGTTVWLEWWKDSLTARMDGSLNGPKGRVTLDATDEPGVFKSDLPPISRDRVVFEESDTGEVTGFIFEAAIVRKLA